MKHFEWLDSFWGGWWSALAFMAVLAVVEAVLR